MKKDDAMKTSKITIRVVLFIVFLTDAIVQAQDMLPDENPESQFFRTIRANQQESYITFGGGFGNMPPLIFEAKVAPYFLLRTSENARWGATMSPTIIMRMCSEESFPVRTPSYMPHLTLYRQINSTANNRIQYLFLTLAHHSNGQEDNFYLPDGSINTFSGDFSTNYIEMGFFFNERFVPFSNTTEYFRTSVEYHFNYYRTRELDGQYGFLRLNNSLRVFRTIESIRRFELRKASRIQTTLQTTWIFGRLNNAGILDLAERLNASLTIAFRPGVLSDVGFFVNFYTGKDYYNIFFDERISVIRFGIQAFTKR